jgi:antitoxin MazE
MVKVLKWGNGVGIRIPADAFRLSGMSVGQEVEVLGSAAGLMIRPGRKVYSLAELCAKFDPATAHETISWGPDVGAEIIDD